MAFVLIIDDDDIVSERASDTLIAAGHACGWVTDVEKARTLLRWRRPDLVLLDQDLPGVTGGTFLREIRSSAQFYDLPVIMFTAATSASDETRALYNGAQDYIRKPFDPKFLIWRVNHALEMRAARPQHQRLEEWLQLQDKLDRDGTSFRSLA